MKKIYYFKIKFREYDFYVYADENELLEITFGDISKRFNDAILVDPSKIEILNEANKELSEYFSGKRKSFNLRLAPFKTKFLSDVYNYLYREVRYGRTISYSELSEAVGVSRGARAVGNAMANNPIPIIIPCHRVLRLDKSLGSYAGGVELKHTLLELESSNL